MSAILSADDLNDFITPGVACIKPVETLPEKNESNEASYEVTTEDKVAQQNPPPPAQINLTDCLACSGCVTSAEAVLVSLQSQEEVLTVLDGSPEFQFDGAGSIIQGNKVDENNVLYEPKIFVASVSPQVRASIAATYGLSQRQAGYLIEQFLSGPKGLRAGGHHGSGFTWVVDTNVMRDVCLNLTAREVSASISKTQSKEQAPADADIPQQPVLASACPGWICYAEKTHPHVLPHMSRLKSPQALSGTLLKSVLSKALNIHSSQIWHLAIMPCFDKKLEASRGELTNAAWANSPSDKPVRDVDCVITSRELLMLADSRGIDLRSIPTDPLPPTHTTSFPDKELSTFLFPSSPYSAHGVQSPDAGTSGGYLYHLLTSEQRRIAGTQLHIQRGRNADVVEYILAQPDGTPVLKAARYYGFRNIQNLVRKLKPAKPSRLLGANRARAPQASSGAVGRRPAKTAAGSNTSLSDYAYIEVMACPGGCTNGGGQIRLEDAQAATKKRLPDGEVEQAEEQKSANPTSAEIRAWLGKVEEAYRAADPGTAATEAPGEPLSTDDVLKHWSETTDVPLSKLVYTTYHHVESDVGKNTKEGGETARVVELAGKIGGGW